MNNRLSISSFNQNFHQPALEHSTGIESTLADLQPISDLTEGAAYTNRVGTSVTRDLRSPSTAAPITQGSLKRNSSNQKLVPVPPALRLPNEDDNTRITLNALDLRKRNRQRVPVPLEFRRPNEDDYTHISLNALQKRKDAKNLVPVPPEFRLHNEDDNTRINHSVLHQRKRKNQLVSVPPELRRSNEDDNTRSNPHALSQRRRRKQSVPVPPELRRPNENDNTRISVDTLQRRKRKRLKSAVPPGEVHHPLHQAGESSATNTLTDSHSAASQNSQGTANSQADSNKPLMHETTPQDMTDAFDFPAPLYSDTAFSHWMDDLKTQQSAIDHLFIDQNLDAPGTGGPL